MGISLKNLRKSFGALTVFDALSLEIETGETLVLFGPSGAGKTVLLRLIAGVIEPDAGEIRLHGRDMKGVEPEDRGVGMAFQNFALFPHLDAFANIAAPLEARRQSASQIRQGVEAVARLLKIDHVLDHKPKALSNGQKQRTALARALSGKPSILLLDDPLRNVDAKLRFEMRLELPRLLKAQNATTIYVTQDYKEAMALGRRIAVMGGGGVSQIGSPEEIYHAPATTDIARLFGDPPINLIPARMEAGAARVGGQSLPLQGYEAAEGREIFLGLRPEALRFAPEGTPGAFPAVIETETPLNEKTATLLRLQGGGDVMLSRPAGTPAPTQGRVWIAPQPGAALVFDRATGRRLAPSQRGAAA